MRSRRDIDVGPPLGGDERRPHFDVVVFDEASQIRPAEAKSDTLLRTREQLLDEAVRELGFRRRGKKIVSALERAIGAAHHETA
jgi:hypothetical protein